MSEINKEDFITDADGFLLPINNKKLFINEIIGDFNNDFKEIKIYGSTNKPLFLLSTISNILKIPNTTLYRHISTYDEGYEIFRNYKVAVLSVQNGKEFFTKTNVHLLTEHGLYSSMAIGKTEACKKFKRFIHIILEKLKNDREVSFDNAMNDLRNSLNKSMRKTETERDDLILKNHSIVAKLNTYTRFEELINNKQDFVGESDHFYSLYKAYENLVASPCALYVVNPSVIKKKKPAKKPAKPVKLSERDKEQLQIHRDVFGSESEDESELNTTVDSLNDFNFNGSQDDVEYEKKFNAYDHNEVEEEDMELLFAVHSFSSSVVKDVTKFHKLCDLKFLNKKHYSNFIEKLNDEAYSSGVKKVFKASYSNIISKSHEALLEMSYDKVVKDVKKNI
jgi:hypothetical protein